MRLSIWLLLRLIVKTRRRNVKTRRRDIKTQILLKMALLSEIAKYHKKMSKFASKLAFLPDRLIFYTVYICLKLDFYIIIS